MLGTVYILQAALSSSYGHNLCVVTQNDIWKTAVGN